ncbi:hypothetical protein B0T24DRAFT_236384 [Lasiosphaeria ovina]|uniref:Uncharacterized protein n=1 Tax=Lasiosphaeria ovina TaxID=92902 RepID=A0AAE0NAV4_9PEZI|nr:hypothetical protein B0T24DRAFT_236384 [Lasiosphaeria ovina]
MPWFSLESVPRGVEAIVGAIWFFRVGGVCARAPSPITYAWRMRCEKDPIRPDLAGRSNGFSRVFPSTDVRRVSPMGAKWRGGRPPAALSTPKRQQPTAPTAPHHQRHRVP